jgi:hypothetical protein
MPPITRIPEADGERARSAIPLPGWLPLAVAVEVRLIEQDGLNNYSAAILARLAADLRMRDVWKLLDRRDRAGGKYMHPAKSPAHAPRRPPDEAQASAMAETLHFAFCAARDRRTASKLDDVRRTKASIIADADALRRIAEEVDMSVQQAPVYFPQSDLPQYSADAAALRRIAAWKDAVAAEIRGTNDPLTITNDRGDPLERGVQITIAAFLQDRFGDRLDGVSATLTAVALGMAKVPSPQVSRSGFSRPKPG